MRVLVVQDNADLGTIWCRFLIRRGMEATLVTSEREAIAALESNDYDALVLEPVLEGGGGIGIADLAAFRHPDIPIIAVTKSTFFSDGSIFSVIPNASGLLRTPIRPDDLMAYLEHFAAKKATMAQRQA